MPLAVKQDMSEGTESIPNINFQSLNYNFYNIYVVSLVTPKESNVFY